MADQKSYPVPLWDPSSPLNGDHLAGKLNPTYAHNKKQEDELLAIGYTDSHGNYPHKDYPRRVYHQNGENVIVVDAKDEKAKEKLGYTRKVVAAKTAAAPVASSALDGQTKNRVDELEGRIDELTQSISDLQADNAKTAATLEEILSAVTSRK